MPLQRHAFNSRQGFRVYNPSRRHQQSFKHAFQQAMHSVNMSWDDTTLQSRGPWEVTLVFYFRRSSRSRVSAMNIPGQPDIYCTKTPDIDNCIKFVLDALNGVAYHDDKQVAKVTATKKWMTTTDTEGCILVKLNPMTV